MGDTVGVEDAGLAGVGWKAGDGRVGGLGRDLGMAAGMASFISYSVFEASLCGLFAYFGNAWVQSHFGVNISWVWFAIFMIALISVLAYRDVQLSAKILGVAEDKVRVVMEEVGGK